MNIVNRCTCIVLLLLSGFGSAATYEGSNGLYAKVFSSNSVQPCNDCHFGTPTVSYPSFDSYENFSIYVSLKGSVFSAWSAIYGRLHATTGTVMPSTGSLNSTELALFDSWTDLRRYNPPAPSTNSASDILKYSVNLQGSMSTNVVDTTTIYKFKWGESGSFGNITSTQTGGSSITKSISGLQCGTAYNYKLISENNGEYGEISGSSVTFSTPACGAITADDLDGDEIKNEVDNCPDNGNTDQANFDTDSEGDVCDLDDDNDGLPDIVEDSVGLDPFDVTDATGDIDGDGLSNLEEYQTCIANGVDPCNALTIDSIAPVFLTTTNVTTTAQGTFTEYIQQINAMDAKDGVIAASPDNAGPYASGRNFVTWTAIDKNANAATWVQTVDILPRIQLPTELNSREGSTLTIEPLSDGQPPSFPVTLSIEVDGSVDSLDYVIDTTLVWSSGDQPPTIDLTLVDDGVADVNESMILTLGSIDGDAISGIWNTTVINILDEPADPIISIVMEQSSTHAENRVYKDQGNLNLNATISNPVTGSVVNWNIAETDYVGPSQILPVGAMSTGTLVIKAILEKDGLTLAYVEKSVEVIDSAPVLTGVDSDSDGFLDTDISEGWADADSDGIPNYKDAITDASQLPFGSELDSLKNSNIQTTPGIQLEIGSLSNQLDHSGIRISTADLPATILPEGMVIQGGILDFLVTSPENELNQIDLIIPLESGLVSGAELWFIDTSDLDSGWSPVILNSKNQILSIYSPDGNCQDPELSWNNDLINLSNCLRLTMQNDGANDAIVQTNLTDNQFALTFAILVPDIVDGSVFSKALEIPSNSPTGGGLDWFVLLLGGLVWRFRNH